MSLSKSRGFLEAEQDRGEGARVGGVQHGENDDDNGENMET